MTETPLRDLIIIGGGPAGLAAALYAGRARLDVLLLEQMLLGGQVAVTAFIENYPGFPDGVSGAELVELMERQARRFGARIENEETTSLLKPGDHFRLQTTAGSHRARSVIVATGAARRWLDVPGEKQLQGRGVSYCAVCDGALFRNKVLVVVGGGDSAVDEGHYLTRFASRVYIVHRRDKLRAEKFLQERAFANPKIEFIWDTVVTAIEGEEKVERAALKNVKTGQTSQLAADGVFIYIGLEPRSGFLPPEVKKDDQGFVVADPLMQTSLPGLFVAGDLRSGSPRQIASSVGDGAQAAISAGKYLETL
jgi:thioredoxin reductase (NADPH)